MNWNKWFGLPKSPALKLIVIMIYGFVAVMAVGLLGEVFFG